MALGATDQVFDHSVDGNRANSLIRYYIVMRYSLSSLSSPHLNIDHSEVCTTEI